jgi:predicted phage tail protein
MTLVRIHGILGQEFPPQMKLKLDKPKQVVTAIDANRKNFINRIHQLALEGCHYTILVDSQKIGSLSELDLTKKAERIDLVPVIAGAGPAIPAIGTFLVGLFTLGTVQAGVGLATFVGSVALVAVSVGLQLLLAPKPDSGPPISASTRALQESFIFSNKANLADQGSPVPVGYGRLILGSQVVQYTNKSFPQNQASTDAMLANPFTAADDAETYTANPAVIDSR